LCCAIHDSLFIPFAKTIDACVEVAVVPVFDGFFYAGKHIIENYFDAVLWIISFLYRSVVWFFSTWILIATLFFKFLRSNIPAVDALGNNVAMHVSDFLGDSQDRPVAIAQAKHIISAPSISRESVKIKENPPKEVSPLRATSPLVTTDKNSERNSRKQPWLGSVGGM